MEKNGQKILIAEDDGFISEVYSTKLSSIGYQVSIAGDGQEALDKLKEETFDLVMLDILMPRVNGLDVLEKMHSDAKMKDIPVIILTNAADKENVERALSLGADGFMIKSNFTPEEVVNKVKEVLK